MPAAALVVGRLQVVNWDNVEKRFAAAGGK
jgi:hypothetical protein